MVCRFHDIGKSIVNSHIVSHVIKYCKTFGSSMWFFLNTNKHTRTIVLMIWFDHYFFAGRKHPLCEFSVLNDLPISLRYNSTKTMCNMYNLWLGFMAYRPRRLFNAKPCYIHIKYDLKTNSFLITSFNDQELIRLHTVKRFQATLCKNKYQF